MQAFPLTRAAGARARDEKERAINRSSRGFLRPSSIAGDMMF